MKTCTEPVSTVLNDAAGADVSQTDGTRGHGITSGAAGRFDS
jgi:hypothetical protein